MGCLEAYFDEAGIHASAPHCVMAGFVAGARVWVRFGANWLKVLRRHRVSRLHAKDLFNAGGEFLGWTDEQRAGLLEELFVGVGSSKIHPIGFAVPNEVFMEHSEGVRRYLTGGGCTDSGKWVLSGKPSAPYFLSFGWVVYLATRYAKPGVRVNFCFDQQDQYEGHARTCFPEFQSNQDFGHHLGDLKFSSSQNAPGLQLADLLVHLLYKELRDGAGMDRLAQWCLGRLFAEAKSGELILYDENTRDKIFSVIPPKILRLLEERKEAGP